MRAGEFVTEVFGSDSRTIPLTWGRELGQVYALSDSDAPGEPQLHINFWDMTSLSEKGGLVAEVDFSVGGNFELTGQGRQFQIFNTVLGAITQYAKEYDPQYLIFSAKEPNRRDLYARMIRLFAPRVGFELIPTSDLTTHAEYQNSFVLKKINTPDSDSARSVVSERRRGRRRRPRAAAWGPGPYGGYGYLTGWSGDGGGSDGGGVGESIDGTPQRGVKYSGTPNLADEWNEAERYPEFQKWGREAWFDIGNRGRRVRFSSLGRVNNHVLDLSSLDPEKLQHVQTSILRDEIDYPIVGRWPDGSYELIAGNTRTAVLRSQGYDPWVWLIEIPSDDERLDEAAYPGNIGLMELARFFREANDEQKQRFKQLADRGLKREAWQLVQQVVGVELHGKEFHESATDQSHDLMSVLERLLRVAAHELELDSLPRIRLVKKMSTSTTFGHFDPSKLEICLAVQDRHPIDIARTLAHELVHFQQGQAGRIQHDSGQTGSEIENEANARAGVILRRLNQRFPEHFDMLPMTEDADLGENFHDGRNPGRRGLSRRVGIPKGATLAELEKIARSSTGERRRMAQWQLNMRRGRAKKD